MSPRSAPPSQSAPPPRRRPKREPRSTQWKVGVSLGILGFVLWLVNVVVEIRAVFDETNALMYDREWEQPGDPFSEQRLERIRRDLTDDGVFRAELEHGIVSEDGAETLQLELTLRVYRRAGERDGSGYTEVRLDDSPTIHRLPDAPAGDDAAARLARDQALAAIRAAVAERMASESIQPARVAVEIVAAEPQTGEVPSDDVDRLMNILYRLGISDILYNDGR